MSLRWIASLALVAASCANGQSVERVGRLPSGLKPLQLAIVGRVQVLRDGSVLRQWPGTYFETATAGDATYFRLGAGQVSLRISVDGAAPLQLVKPAPGLYRVFGLGTGKHRVRVDVASESQAGPTNFGGFFGPAPINVAPLPHRSRQIEFIGDSHTVGYGNTSPTRQCTGEEVWATTDTSRGLAPLTAKHYGADYQVNAISGRGIVRNYNGFPADTLPQAYPYTLFDRARVARDPYWHPQVIVIGLGTNDFSTPLNSGEKWKSREQLQRDFEATYVRFVQQLHARHPRAYVILWATDLSKGEIQSEVAKVVERLHRTGDSRVGFVPIAKLAFSGCDSHPSLGDDRTIAEALISYLDAQPSSAFKFDAVFEHQSNAWSP